MKNKIDLIHEDFSPHISRTLPAAVAKNQLQIPDGSDLDKLIFCLIHARPGHAQDINLAKLSESEKETLVAELQAAAGIKPLKIPPMPSSTTARRPKKPRPKLLAKSLRRSR